MLKLSKWSLPFLLIIVTYLSLRPKLEGLNIPVNDKTGHYLAYLTLSLNACIVTRKNPSLIFALFGLLFYSALIELLQSLIPGRTASWLDMLANSAGILTGLLIFFSIRKKIESYFQPK